MLHVLGNRFYCYLCNLQPFLLSEEHVASANACNIKLHHKGSPHNCLLFQFMTPLGCICTHVIGYRCLVLPPSLSSLSDLHLTVECLASAGKHKTDPQLKKSRLRYLSKKGCELVAILRNNFVKTKSQTHRDCIIAKFANSVNTYAHTYGHHILCAFRELRDVSTRIARTLHEHTLHVNLREVFAYVSLPFFDKYHMYFLYNIVLGS